MEGKSHNCAHQPRLLGLHPVPSTEPWKVFNHDTIKSYFGKTTPASRNQQERAMQAQEAERTIQVKKKGTAKTRNKVVVTETKTREDVKMLKKKKKVS